ncbi:malonic semialdehyde reductase [Pseudomonas gingeri NCPPB 3146 = LMG 5327]|uniref:Malonic semialdehyde reductase n=2 Tax=Pseudomonas gingeri TaxID=117681 RepID=A0A7Y8CG24_9PSED|nr:malonic semialdehyde reductase [Pseudomonas gingeri]NVZ25559.1 malonic semialdehyde reductase [Pseudomonas gingeri]NWC16811.1 malonic semialdehyde reductase [Pseudomonas gingeri]PNQ87820.1 malonic semialdehyde reductase [Pseudomonas gingeri NCPPB 3146 = LMG 5327]
MNMPLSDELLDQVFRKARTFNSFIDRPVAQSTIRALYDLLKWGPTSTNQQPLRVVWCHSPEAKERLAALCYAGNAEKVRAAPVTAILGMELDFVRYLPRLFPHADARGWYGDDQRLIAESAFRNSSLQGAYFIIAARMLGLDTNPMSGFDEEQINASFFADSSIRVNFIATLGYGDSTTLYERAPRLDFDEANRFI